MSEKSLAADGELRRAAYGEYAKAAVCRELGGELLPKARTHAQAAQALYAALVHPTEEDARVLRELGELLAAVSTS